MSSENLILKAKTNFKVAKYCETNKFYDVAISRFYYYLYQFIICYLKDKISSDYYEKDNSHVITIDLFLKEIEEKNVLKDHERTQLQLLHKLRRSRIQADYRHYIVSDENKYIETFGQHFYGIDKILKNICVITGV